jgi:hypothetical protein
MTALAIIEPTESQPTNVALFNDSRTAAGLCKEIVLQSAIDLQGKKYLPVEAWQAIALAHGCVLSSGDVTAVDGGVTAIGYVRRMSDGQEIARAEGFVGEDETTWFGGKNKWGKEMAPRNMFAIRAMAQTRAMSRAGRSAFAHVVVMMKAGLETTPAEEMQAVHDVQPVNQAATMRPPEEELKAWQDWADKAIAGIPTLDREALTKFEKGARFRNGQEALDAAGDPRAEKLRSAVMERADELEAQA